jgi:hypothetical protein
MSDTLLMWLFGGAFAGILGLAGLWWSHVKECREVRAALATLNANMAIVLREIGTHETGLRGSFHDLRDRMTPLAVWAEREMERRT